jgi:hypothetical protein
MNRVSTLFCEDNRMERRIQKLSERIERQNNIINRSLRQGTDAEPHFKKLRRLKKKLRETMYLYRNINGVRAVM